MYPGLLTPAFLLLVLQVTNAGVRRPGYEATGLALISASSKTFNLVPGCLIDSYPTLSTHSTYALYTIPICRHSHFTHLHLHCQLHLLTSHTSYLASFPGHSHLQSLIACSMQIWS